MEAKSGVLTVRELVLYTLLGTVMFALKIVMAGLPNIEPVTLSLMVYGAVFGLKALYPAYVYVAMEILYFGLGPWNICYFYIWAIPVVAAILLRNMHAPIGWAVLSGAYGLLFGALCAPVDFLLGDLGYVVAKWVSGLSFDVLHAVGNFVIALLAFAPLRLLLEKLYHKLRT